MPTGAKNVLYIRDLGMTTYNLLNFKMRLVAGYWLLAHVGLRMCCPFYNLSLTGFTLSLA